MNMVPMGRARAVLDGFTITGGYANGGGSDQSQGGGMYLFAQGPVIVRCLFQGNHADQFGGAIHADYSNPIIADCVFTGNDSTYGGALASYGNSGSPRVDNCVFYANAATSGSALFGLLWGSPVVSGCTFLANSGSTIKIDVLVNLSLTHCVLWGNPAGEIELGGCVTANVNRCVVQGGWPGSGNLNADPMFLNPASPAGIDGRWFTADDGLRLGEMSPGANLGDPALLPPDAADLDGDGNTTEALPLDGAGALRVIDGAPEPGAYEINPEWVHLPYWRTIHFAWPDREDPAMEVGLWGDAADPDGDGIPNRGEYAMMLDPRRADAPAPSLVEVFPGWRWLVWEYHVAKNRPDVIITPLRSADLSPGSWTVTGIYQDISGDQPLWQIRRAMIPVTPPHGFLRLAFDGAGF